MKNTSKKTTREIGKMFGVNLTIDKTLGKYAKTVPEKFEKSDKLLANSTFNF